METLRSKRRRLISSNVSSRRRPDLPAIFESLNDDTLTTVLEFVGDKSYRSFGVNKRCKEVYLNTKGMTKETFVYGYAPLSVITDRYDSDPSFKAREALSKGVLFYNRRDVLAWALQQQKKYVLNRICYVAAREGRIDILEEVWNNDEEIFEGVDECAALHGKLNVLKWFENKGLSIHYGCAIEAAQYAQLHILQWLQDYGLELDKMLYCNAALGGHLDLMKWLREQGCPLGKNYTFGIAAEKGNLDVLQWLHDEGCPWPEDNDDDRVREQDLEPEVIDWCRVNGYDNRIVFRND